MNDTIVAALLGVLEGLTEFIPVSSTAHLLLAGHFLGFSSPTRTFEVVIQMGSVLAVVGLYAQRLWAVFRVAPHDPQARRFIWSVLLAFFPAVFIGVLAHDFIKTVLYESPMLIAVMLVLGGIVLLVVDKLPLRPVVHDAMKMPLGRALAIGFCQCIAMIPGVSRSGATIVGAMLMGVDKRAAAEFSFFLAMPTMAGAFAYDLFKNRDALSGSDLHLIVVGFILAFLSALIVVRWVLGYVSRHGYALFGWWRIVVGCAAIVALWATGS